MPKTPPAQLAAKAAYNARPENVKKREENNAARRKLEAQGRVHKGDGKDVAHVVALQDGGTNSDANLEVTTQKANRGWRKGHHDYNVGKQK